MKIHALRKILAVSVIAAACSAYLFPAMAAAQEKAPGAVIALPAPKLDGAVSVEKALAERRSVRAYKSEALSLEEVSQILWAAQGITDPSKGYRTAPSARGTYVIQVYLVAGNVSGLPAGLYKYEPKGHALVKLSEGDKKGNLLKAAGQAAIGPAPAALIISGVTDRSAANPNWMYLEAGHASENVYLQAFTLKLGTVAMAGFKPEEVKRALSLPEKEQPIYIMPFGRK
jgi:SagB-type dehydrogenase family enzyme